MASFHKLPSGLWRAQVARGGVRRSTTRTTKAAAQAWAAGIESELIALKHGEMPRKTVMQALEKYAEEVSPKKPGKRWELLRINKFKREAWAERWLAATALPSDLAAWRDRRLHEVTPGSVQRDFNLLKGIFTIARKEWRWLDVDPMMNIEGPGENRPRTKRISWREVRRICRALGYPGKETKSAEVGRIFLIALRTGMRSGEILSLAPEDVNLQTRVAKLRDTKNGDDRDVPMTRMGAKLFEGWTGWTVAPDSRDALFRKACKRAGVTGVHFHDSRAEALTRLSRKVDALTLAKISGHRDLKMLLTRYYRETAEQIAQRLG